MKSFINCMLNQILLWG